MRRNQRVATLCLLAAGLVPQARADESEAKAVVEKAIKAIGGEEKLSGIRGFLEKGKGRITLGDAELDFTFKMTAQGLEKYRSEYEGDAGGTKFEGATVVDGAQAWKKVDADVTKLDGEKLAIEKRNAYLDIVPILILPLRGQGFKLSSAGEEKVGGKPAAVVRVTGPEGKDFTLYFEKDGGLPLKMSASMVDDQGAEDVQEQTYEDYKDFGGIKVSTRSRITRGGKPFIEVEATEFKVLGEFEPGTFAEPK